MTTTEQRLTELCNRERPIDLEQLCRALWGCQPEQLPIWTSREQFAHYTL